jgi:hypothetical protein
MIRYSAFVLSELDRQALLNEIYPKLETGFLNQAGWEEIAHHCTINMGKLEPEFVPFIGNKYELKITGIGINERVIAVRISKNSQAGLISKNKCPHITIAVNRAAGAKPVESNNIENWEDWYPNITILGEMKEVE